MSTDPNRFSTIPSTTTLPWIDSPFFPQLLENSGLDEETREIVRRFARDGYVIIDPKISSSTIDGAIADLQHRFKPTYEPYYADEKRLQDGWYVTPHVKAIALAERVMELLRILYRRDPIPFQTLNFCRGSEQRTHSDTIHFHSFPQHFMAGVWMALEDVDDENGPLHYYPKSHTLPIYTMSDLGVMASSPTALYDQYWMYEDFVEALMKAKELERVNIKVERGQALIWSANLFHGGTPIKDQARTRLSQVTHYFFDDCIYYTPLLSDPALGRISLRKINNIARGEFAEHQYIGRRIANPDSWPLQLHGHELSEIPGRIVDYKDPSSPAEAARDSALPVKSRIKRLIEKTLSIS